MSSAIAIVCPRCGAASGTPCFSDRGAHVERVASYAFGAPRRSDVGDLLVRCQRAEAALEAVIASRTYAAARVAADETLRELRGGVRVVTVVTVTVAPTPYDAAILHNDLWGLA